MKKLVSLILSASLLLGTAQATFGAENPLGDTLSKVTEKVKAQLDIGDEYSVFNGMVQDDGLNEFWNLSWEGEDGTRLSVDATTEGKIMGYYLSLPSEDYRYEQDFAPKFPQLSWDTGKAIARKFLNKVIDTSMESIEFNDSDGSAQLQNAQNYYYSGNLKLNGVASPISFSVRVNTSNQVVTHFSRSDMNEKYVGGVPNSEAATSIADAVQLLKSTMKLKLEYTTDNMNSNSDQKDQAVLRYMPISAGNYYVDAQTGKLVNINDLYDDLNESGFAQSSITKDSDAEGVSREGLSKAEQAGIEKLDDVMTKDQLDAAVRGMSELGLSGFDLTDSRYFKDDEDNYFCNLTYVKAEDKNNVTRKYAHVDAKTGQLISLYTNYPFQDQEEKETLSSVSLQKNAEAFLTKYFKDNYAQTKLYTETGNVSLMEDTNVESFVFAQQVNGYFFPENAYRVGVNSASGIVDSFDGDFRDVTFQSPQGIVSLEEAENAYFKAFDTTLSYVSVPKKLDFSSPEYEKYISNGYGYLYELKLAYTATAQNAPYAVDAKTGKNLYDESYNKETISYSDVKSGKEILALASYGIGFSGGVFQKEKELTQIDMVELLVSADGNKFETYSNADEADGLYQAAYNLGILKKEQRNDNLIITRTELVKTILSMSGYGEVAQLKGIYVCSFKDEGKIPDEYYGYVAIAQGLGMVKGGTNVEFQPNATATREQAAIMLYNFMNR